LSKSSKPLLLLKPGFINNNNSNNNIEPLPLTESLESLVILLKPRYSEDNKNPLLNIYSIIIIYNLNIYKYNQSV
jgi:hypothetical protein